MNRKPKKKSWHQLREEKCPKCGATLMRDLFGEGYIGCSCGFNLNSEVKNILIARDNDS